MASFGEYGSSKGYTSSYQSGYGQDSMADFARLAQHIGKNVQKVSQNINQIKRFSSQIGTAQDSDQMRDKLHEVQHYTNQVAKETGNYLKELTHLPKAQSQSEQKQRKMQQERLVDEFTETLNTFQALQRTVTAKEKDSIKRTRAHSGLGGTSNPFADDSRGAEYRDYEPEAAESSSQKVLQMEADIDLELIQEREQSIKKLEADIMDVNTIFKDLGMLVHEQGEMIDSIEANVESAHIQVEEGTTQLSKAKDYQSKARRKKCCIIVIILVILAVVGVIIGVSVGSKK